MQENNIRRYQKIYIYIKFKIFHIIFKSRLNEIKRMNM